VATVSVSEVAMERIRQLIISGELAPGQRLPSEPKLAAQLGLSRSALREAISALAQARVLMVRRGDGTYVSSLEPEQLLGGLSVVIDLMRGQTLLEVFEVRRLLEPAATGLAATRITDAQVDELRRSLRAMRQADTVEEFIALDVEFHRSIIAVIGNHTLVCLIDALATQGLRARIWRGVSQDGVHTFTLEQHGKIVEALANRDANLAQAASAMHLSSSQQWLREVIAAQEADCEVGARTA
jgi:GntR family transcriptional regulator, transcriptional repressor for pyruvate dehydrogenase complex